MISSVENVLVVDDDTLMREFVVETLRRCGITVKEAANGDQARRLLEDRDYDMAFLDIKMPGMSGMDVLRWKHEAGIPTLVVMITAFGTVELAVDAMKLGAVDFLMKPFSPEQVEVIVNRAREWVRLAAENRYLKEELGLTLAGDRRLLGRSVVMQRLMEQIDRVAVAPSTVLIAGESGTGKELVAQAVHELSGNREHPFVRMNCAAVPETLADSELFGHEKGAFTGALNRRAGRFELAGDGTLLLDEISEMPLNLQAKLLRVIQEREFERVGGSRTLRTTCRLIATTNRDLEAFVREGGFRQDLYYRLNVVPLRVPPLRERVEDIPLLVDTFLNRYLKRMPGRERGLRFRDDAMAILQAYAWPGNVRELEHLVERLCVMEAGPEVVPSMLPRELCEQAPASVFVPAASPEAMQASAATQRDADITDTPPPSGARLKLEDIEREAILAALRETGGQRNKAADLLGISIRTLRNKLTRYRSDNQLPDEPWI